MAQALESGEQGRPPFALVVCKHPYLLYARVAQWFDAARRPALPGGTHPSAVVAADAVIEEGVRIGPLCVVESGARIGRGAVLGPGCVIGAGSSVGPDSLLHAHVTLYEGVKVGARAILHSGVVLGADGFGFAPDPSLGQGAWGKIPSWAAWPSATTSRSAPTPRSIAARSKTPSWPTASSWTTRSWWVTTAASARTQRWPRAWGGRFDHHRRALHIGGAAMLSGHLTLGDDVHISGGTAVTSNILKPGRYTGVFPYAEHGEWQRNAAVIQQLAQLRRRVRSLESVRRGSAARRTPQDHFISQEFTEKWNSTSRGSWSVCRIVTRCC